MAAVQLPVELDIYLGDSEHPTIWRPEMPKAHVLALIDKKIATEEKSLASLKRLREKVASSASETGI